MKLKIILLALGIGALGISANAGETASQAQVRAQLANFWQIAETRVAEAPSPVVADRYRAESPVRTLRRTETVPCRVVATPVVPPSVVEAEQSVRREQDSGHFGFQVLGGLRIFDFTWGDERVEETDRLKGRL